MRFSGYLFALTLSTAGAAQAQDWDGWYAGLGYDSSDYSFDMPLGSKTYTINGVPFVDGSDDGGDGNGGVLIAGRLWQRDKLVYGLELDLGGSKAGFEVESSADVEACTQFPCTILGVGSELQTRGHFRSIIGLASSSKLMVFGSLGIASASFDPTQLYSFSRTSTGGSGAIKNTNALVAKTVYGPSIGIGAQYKVGRSFVLRGEVMRDSYSVDFPDFTDLGAGWASGSGDSGDSQISTGNGIDGSSFDIDNTTARLSLIFQF